MRNKTIFLAVIIIKYSRGLSSLDNWRNCLRLREISCSSHFYHFLYTYNINICVMSYLTMHTIYNNNTYSKKTFYIHVQNLTMNLHIQQMLRYLVLLLGPPGTLICTALHNKRTIGLLKGKDIL